MSDGLERLRAARLIAVLRSESPEAAVNAAVALADAGVRAIELTFTTPGAPEALREARERLPADVSARARSAPGSWRRRSRPARSSSCAAPRLGRECARRAGASRAAAVSLRPAGRCTFWPGRMF